MPRGASWGGWARAPRGAGEDWGDAGAEAGQCVFVLLRARARCSSTHRARTAESQRVHEPSATRTPPAPRLYSRPGGGRGQTGWGRGNGWLGAGPREPSGPAQRSRAERRARIRPCPEAPPSPRARRPGNRSDEVSPEPGLQSKYLPTTFPKHSDNPTLRKCLASPTEPHRVHSSLVFAFPGLPGASVFSSVKRTWKYRASPAFCKK